MDIFFEYGYVGLFISSFLAATLLPGSSEIVLSLLLLNHSDPLFAVCVATFGNVLGSVVNYGVGFRGSYLLFRKWLGYSERDILAAEQRFARYGVLGLLLAWVPVIGDPLTVAAGILKIHFGLFLALVTVGKLARYIVLAVSVLSL